MCHHLYLPPKSLNLLNVTILKAPCQEQIYWSNLKYSNRDLLSNNFCVIVCSLEIILNRLFYQQFKLGSPEPDTFYIIGGLQRSH